MMARERERERVCVCVWNDLLDSCQQIRRSQPLRTAPNRHQPPTANRQPPTTNRGQPPPTVQYRFCGLVSCPCLDHEAESVPVNVRFCWHCKPFLFPLKDSPSFQSRAPCGARGTIVPLWGGDARLRNRQSAHAGGYTARGAAPTASVPPCGWLCLWGLSAGGLGTRG